MPRSIALLVKNENDAAQGFLQAFAQEGNEVSCIVCNELLPVALQMAKPDFAIVASPDVWGDTGSAQQLLDAMGIPFLGSRSCVIRACRNGAQLLDTLDRAIACESIEAARVPHVALDKTCLDALAQTGQVQIIADALGKAWPLVARGNDAALLDAGTSASNGKDLSETLTRLKQTSDQVVVTPAIEGVEMIVPIMGDLGDVLILPPIEVSGDLCDEGSWKAPVDLSHLSSDIAQAQDIRSEVERCALDAFIACDCRDWACVRLVWDGGKVRILDVDAAPSLTAGSPIAYALQAAGIDLAELAAEFCELADERR